MREPHRRKRRRTWSEAAPSKKLRVGVCGGAGFTETPEKKREVGGLREMIWVAADWLLVEATI